MASFIKLTFVFLVSIIVLNLQTGVLSQPLLSPAPAPTSDGSSIDLGIAYVLMFVALAVTYFVHPIDSFPFNLF